MAPAQKFDVARDDVEADLLRSESLPARLDGHRRKDDHFPPRQDEVRLAIESSWSGWSLVRFSASYQNSLFSGAARRRNERSVKLLASDHAAIKRLGLLVRFGIDPVHRNRHSRLG